MPIKQIDEKGIVTYYKGQNITFEFITNPIVKLLNEVKEIYLKENQINFLKEEIVKTNITRQLQSNEFQLKVKHVEESFKSQTYSNLPNAFWERKQHIVSLPYEESFNEKNIPTKARPYQMNKKYLELCKKEINDLLNKNLIRKSYSP